VFIKKLQAVMYPPGCHSAKCCWNSYISDDFSLPLYCDLCGVCNANYVRT